MKFSHKAKKLGLKYYAVDIDMFDYQVKLVIGDHKKTIELVNTYEGDGNWYDDGHPPRGQMFCTNPQIHTPIIWIPKAPETSAEHGTFAHECCHAVVRLFAWGGLPVDGSTDELFAHAVGYLIESFYRKLECQKA